jgi:predicted regulator of Ras-like GTPase activity (Roadblock/LC7/MglB family)
VEKPAEKSPVKSETAEPAKVVWPKTESARLAILAPAKAQPPVPVPKFDAKDAVAKALALPGITSCGIIFADGLTIAGNIPAEMHVDGLSAMAPTLLQKVEKHMLETQLGALTCLTVYGEKAPVTFFAFGNVCLTAMHGAAELTAETRRELATITKELSRTYAQPGTAHVDH